MRAKYNSIFTNSVNTEKSHIEKYLGEEIETILNPDATSIHGVAFDEIYVNMPVIEAQLLPLTTHNLCDRCVFLTGVTGCGKTSVLRHTFHIEKSVHINGASLYIPVSFDHALYARTPENTKDYFTNIIKVACEILEREIHKTQKTVNDDGFIDFIRIVRHDDLQFNDAADSNACLAALDMLKRKNRIEYYCLRLKYYLTELPEINHVVLIVDDIEAVGYKNELTPIDIGLSIWTCLKRPPEDEELKIQKTWSTSVIISCRHYVYRMINSRLIERKYVLDSGIDSQTIESYPIDDEINIPESVRLVSIIEERVQKLRFARKDKRWDDAWAVVSYILNQVDEGFGDFIVALSINNIRKALSVLKSVVLNKRWIQRSWAKEGGVPGAFSINCISEYNLSPPCLLRAIGLKEGNVYSHEDSIIPNIISNAIDECSDFILLLTIKAFINQTNSSLINWRTSLDCNRTANKIKRLLREVECHAYVDEAIQHLILSRLLLRSQNQAQDDGIDINKDNVREIRNVYVSKAAFAMWSQLGQSSVLLELFTDDVYIDMNLQKTTKHSNSLIDNKTFERCINYLTELIECERTLRFEAKNDGKSREMNILIGNEFITNHLLSGMILSRRSYYKNSTDFKEELDCLQKRIKQYEKELL